MIWACAYLEANIDVSLIISGSAMPLQSRGQTGQQKLYVFTVNGGRLISHRSDQTTVGLHTDLTLNTVEQKHGAFQVSSKATDTQQP